MRTTIEITLFAVLTTIGIGAFIWLIKLTPAVKQGIISLTQ